MRLQRTCTFTWGIYKEALDMLYNTELNSLWMLEDLTLFDTKYVLLVPLTTIIYQILISNIIVRHKFINRLYTADIRHLLYTHVSIAAYSCNNFTKELFPLISSNEWCSPSAVQSPYFLSPPPSPNPTHSLTHSRGTGWVLWISSSLVRQQSVVIWSCFVWGELLICVVPVIII